MQIAGSHVRELRVQSVSRLTIHKDRRGKCDRETFLLKQIRPAAATALRCVMALDAAAGLGLGYFELEPNEEFDAAPLAECRIDAGVLENILAEADGL